MLTYSTRVMFLNMNIITRMRKIDFKTLWQPAYRACIVWLPAMVFSAINVGAQTADRTDLKLWFNQPAKEWSEAIPVGNGRLGAMIFGNVDAERLQLNESSVWSGSPSDFVNPLAKNSLAQVRKLLFEGTYAEAEKLANANLMGDKKVESSYQTLGDLMLTFDHEKQTISNYRRELNLENAIARVQYTVGRTNYSREIFSSAADQLIIVRLTADKPDAISFSVNFSRPGNKATIEVDDSVLWMREHVNGGSGVHMVAAAKVIADGGQVNATTQLVTVSKANAVTILISAATDYRNNDYEELASAQLASASSRSFADLKDRHVNDYQKYFRRVTFDLGTSDEVYFPTDTRIAAMQQGNVDPQLIALYYQFGRYLMISSSRPGGLPANLQGIWADGLTPPWSADYHININVQMNYWMTELTNLSELHEPFLRFISDLREDGKKTARDMYGLKGAVAHFTTDAWHFTETYGEPRWAMWPMGLAWSVGHLWEHYLFTKDEQFLRTMAYPAMKDAAVFCEQWLVKDPSTGYLVSGPSISPENTFYTADGKVATMVMGPTMDHMIIRELFENTIAASRILNADQSLRSSLQKALANLSPTKIASDGRIQEWSFPFQENEPGHRHISHLYGLHPGNEITKDSALVRAARKTIDYRLAHGGGHTGWSRAWIINFFARLHDGDAAYENLLALLRKSTLPNLFDNHPPFQIDGNFGAAAGITEMLLQSHTGEIEILPALPTAWPNGHIDGICARGGFVFDIDWRDGKLSALSMVARVSGECRIRYRTKTITVKCDQGKKYELHPLLQ
jgi:alpha-L-fucosidase 2